MAQTAKDVLAMIKEHNVEFVDFRFLDFPGLWQNVTFSAHKVDEDTFEEGIGFDGSSIRGWKTINNSDMLLMPDPATAMIDPFFEAPTLILICNIIDPITKQPYERDPRYVAQQAENYLKSTGLGDTAFFGPEAEFFVFDDVRFMSEPFGQAYFVDSDEAIWNTFREEEGGNKGYKIRHKEGYFPCAPMDTQQDLRSQMVRNLHQVGIMAELHHHEVATAGQGELGMPVDSLVGQADKLMMFKYVLKNTAAKAGKTLTFMPKPVFNDNGSGMHTHQSIWKDGQPLFAGDEYAGISQMALYYIGGILKHARALVALTNPSTNSYKRLVPGFEAPINLAYSARNRSAAVRIPMYSNSPKAKRIEFRSPDPTCNPYLAFSAMLMAGLDGIQNKIDPGEPLEKDIYDLPAEELAKIGKLPGSLDEALAELEKDHDFLTKGDVFTEDVLQTWIEYKYENEVQALRLRPHPYELYMYYDL